MKLESVLGPMPGWLYRSHWSTPCVPQEASALCKDASTGAAFPCSLSYSGFDLFSFYSFCLHRSQKIQCQWAWVGWVFYTVSVPFGQRCKSPAWNNNQFPQAFKDIVLHLVYTERCWHYLQMSVEHIRNLNVLNELKQNNSEELALFDSFLFQYHFPFPAAQNTNFYSLFFHVSACANSSLSDWPGYGIICKLCVYIIHTIHTYFYILYIT